MCTCVTYGKVQQKKMLVWLRYAAIMMYHQTEAAALWTIKLNIPHSNHTCNSTLSGHCDQ